MSDDPIHQDPDAWIDEQERQERKRKKRLKLLLLGGLLMLIPLGLASIPAYYAIKEWRADTLAEEALLLLESVNAEEGLIAPYEKATSAYHLAPSNILPQRAMAQLYSYIHPPHAYTLWQEVITQDEHTLEDRMRYTETAFAMRDMEVVADELKWFYENNPDYVDAAILRIKWLISEKQFDKALQQARALSGRTDIKPEHRLLYIQLGAQTNDPEIHKETQAYLNEVIQGFTPLSLIAARIGFRIQPEDESLRDKIMLKLRSHPDATVHDKLNSYWMQFKRGSISEDEIYRMANTFIDRENPQDVLTYLRWLNTHGSHEQAVQTLNLEEALSRRDLFVIYLDALAGTQNWERIRSLLNHPKAPLEDYLTELFMVRYHYETNNPNEARQAWDRAMLACEQRNKESAKRLWWIENYAKKMGWHDKRRVVLQRLTRMPSEQRQAYERLIMLEKASEDIQALLRIYREMLEDYPDDTAILNDYAYLRLLIGQEVRDAYRIARELVEENPRYLSFRVTLALAYLRIGQPVNALKVLEEAGIEWKRAPDSYQLIAALVLASIGNRDRANEFLSEIDATQLMPEERDLLK